MHEVAFIIINNQRKRVFYLQYLSTDSKLVVTGFAFVITSQIVLKKYKIRQSSRDSQKTDDNFHLSVVETLKRLTVD